MTLLWLDDTRDPFVPLKDGSSWLVFSPIDLTGTQIVWVKSYDEFVVWITSNGLPAAICFDHDLGNTDHKTGYDCAKWLVNYCIDNQLRLPKYNIQSANPVGKANIDGLFKSFSKI